MFRRRKELFLYGPFLEWLENLKDRRARAIIHNRLDRLTYGLAGKCEPVGNGIFELKIFYGPGYRIYFCEEREDTVVLLWGGDKSTQKRDIKKAQDLSMGYRRYKKFS